LITGADVADDFLSGVRGAITTVRLAKNSNPWTFVIDLAIQALASSVVDSINHHLAARQSVKIMPLSNQQGMPFVAGIKGHQGAIIGDSPGIFDEILMGLTGNPGDGGYIPPEMVTTGLVLSALLGIESPKFTPTAAERELSERFYRAD